MGAGVFTENGHMTYSHDGRWILSDTYPDKLTDERILFLFDTRTGKRHDLDAFYTPPDRASTTAAISTRAGAATTAKYASI